MKVELRLRMVPPLLSSPNALLSELKLQPKLGSHRDTIPPLRCAHAHARGAQAQRARDPFTTTINSSAYKKVTSVARAPSLVVIQHYFFLTAVVMIIIIIFFMVPFAPLLTDYYYYYYFFSPFEAFPLFPSRRHDALLLLGLLGNEKKPLRFVGKRAFYLSIPRVHGTRRGRRRASLIFMKTGAGAKPSALAPAGFRF